MDGNDNLKEPKWFSSQIFRGWFDVVSEINKDCKYGDEDIKLFGKRLKKGLARLAHWALRPSAIGDFVASSIFKSISVLIQSFTVRISFSDLISTFELAEDCLLMTDGSVPNTLVIANCEVVRPRVATAEYIFKILLLVAYVSSVLLKNVWFGFHVDNKILLCNRYIDNLVKYIDGFVKYIIGYVKKHFGSLQCLGVFWFRLWNPSFYLLQTVKFSDCVLSSRLGTNT
uniref:Uncharacterized protein n=1 Tax=Cucumis melo TaxID=3656 RepID=A0A9I9ECQ8_CUCME